MLLGLWSDPDLIQLESWFDFLDFSKQRDYLIFENFVDLVDHSGKV